MPRKLSACERAARKMEAEAYNLERHLPDYTNRGWWELRDRNIIASKAYRSAAGICREEEATDAHIIQDKS